MARPRAVCGRSAGGKLLSAVQPSNDRRRHTLMKWFHIQPLLLCALFFPPCAHVFCLSLPSLSLIFFFFLVSILSVIMLLSPLSTPPAPRALVFSIPPRSPPVRLSLEGGQECRAVMRKSSIWFERDEWCCMVKFNTYLDYSLDSLWFGMWSRFPC